MDKKDLFIEEFLRLRCVTAACKAIGMSRKTYYLWTRKDPDFVRELQELQQFKRELIMDMVQNTFEDLLLNQKDAKIRIMAGKGLLDLVRIQGAGAKLEQQVEQPTETENKLISGLKSILPNPNQPIQRSNVETDHFGNPKTKDTDAGE